MMLGRCAAVGAPPGVVGVPTVEPGFPVSDVSAFSVTVEPAGGVNAKTDASGVAKVIDVNYDSNAGASWPTA